MPPDMIFRDFFKKKSQLMRQKWFDVEIVNSLTG